MQDIRKAAILISNLDKPLAVQMLSQMPRDLIEAVTLEIATLDNVSRHQQDTVLNEFYSLTQHNEAALDLAIDAASQIVDEKPDELVHFAFLQSESPETLVKCIGDEHPQTIALIISHLQKPLAADVLAALPASTRREVIDRVQNIELPTPELIRDVEGALERRMKSTSQRPPKVPPTRQITSRPTQHA